MTMFSSRAMRYIQPVTITQIWKRCLSHATSNHANNNSPLVLCRLHSRALLRISGKDTDEFLQGIITNDIRRLAGGSERRTPPRDVVADDKQQHLCNSLYSLCLNVQGRVLFDTILHRPSCPNSDADDADANVVFIEHDAALTASVRNHLKMYKLRRSVNIDDGSQSSSNNSLLHVWALCCTRGAQVTATNLLDDAAIRIVETLQRTSTNATKELVLPFKDPRPVPALGYRLLIPAAIDVEQSLQKVLATHECDVVNSPSESQAVYHRILYENGVGEGSQDLLPGKSLPLECNADYLDGVSFDKGCYIGQELTARTFHTGVVRKRLLPINLQSTLPSASPECRSENENGKAVSDAPITAEDGSALGKLRNTLADGGFGIALLRVKESLAARGGHAEIQLSDGKKHKVEVRVPEWWPQNAKSEAK